MENVPPEIIDHVWGIVTSLIALISGSAYLGRQVWVARKAASIVFNIIQVIGDTYVERLKKDSFDRKLSIEQKVALHEKAETQIGNQLQLESPAVKKYVENKGVNVMIEQAVVKHKKLRKYKTGPKGGF